MRFALPKFGFALSIAASTISPAAAQPSPVSAAAPSHASIDAAGRKRVVDAAIARMTEDYVFPDKVPAIAKALHEGLTGKYRSLTDPQAFVDAVNSDIEAVANDRHLHIIWSSDPLPRPIEAFATERM